MKTNNPPFLAKLIVISLSGMVAVLTIEGAYSLTGKLLLAMVFGSCVFVQWIAASWAFARFGTMMREPAARLRNLLGGLVGLSVWFLTATFTVSLLGAELNGLMTAKDVGAQRFATEQGRLQQRANVLVTNLDSVRSGLAAFETHASAMAQRERETGSSCMAATGKGAGPVAGFRNGDNSLATSLNSQVLPTLTSLKAELTELSNLQFAANNVGALRAALQQQVDKLNAVQTHPILASVRAAAMQRVKDAEHIEFQNAVFKCQDSAREALLNQVVAAVDSVQELKALVPVTLMDPQNMKNLATASVLSTWSGVTAWLPVAMRVPVSEDLKRQFDISDGPMVLKHSNFGNVLGWVIEAMLLAALLFGLSGDGARNDPAKVTLGPVSQQLIDKLHRKSPLAASILEACIRTAQAKTAAGEAPYVDTSTIFADGDMADRVAAFCKYYRPYGATDLLVVPVADVPAMKAARELELLRSLSRKATALSRQELTSDPRYGAVIDAMDNGEAGPFAVFRVVSTDLIRHILASTWARGPGGQQQGPDPRASNDR